MSFNEKYTYKSHIYIMCQIFIWVTHCVASYECESVSYETYNVSFCVVAESLAKFAQLSDVTITSSAQCLVDREHLVDGTDPDSAVCLLDLRSTNVLT